MTTHIIQLVDEERLVTVEGLEVLLPYLDDIGLIWYPDQTDFLDSLAFGTGGRNWSHTGSVEGQANTIFGIGSGNLLTTGWSNTLFGAKVGANMTDKDTVNTYQTGSAIGNVGNTFVGSYCGNNANGAIDNTGIGANTLILITTGMDNFAGGINAGYNLAGGSENVLLGHAAGQYVIGFGNIGDIDATDLTGGDASWGHRLTMVGDQAGRYCVSTSTEKTGGKKSVYVGARAWGGSNVNAINENVFGYDARGNGSNTVTIGNSSIADTYLAGRVQATGSIRPASYTVGTVPSASAAGAGAMIYVSNESGGGVPAFSDGSAWRRATDRAVIS